MNIKTIAEKTLQVSILLEIVSVLDILETEQMLNAFEHVISKQPEGPDAADLEIMGILKHCNGIKAIMTAAYARKAKEMEAANPGAARVAELLETLLKEVSNTPDSDIKSVNKDTIN